jgi:iron(III) transport system ATP-binding protein
MKPKVLLFDEPLSNLDAKLRVQMRTEIRRLQQKLGITSVYVTHDQDEAMSLSDRIVVMRHGKIEQLASPEEVYRRPASVFVADFIGQANFLDVAGFTVHGTGGTATARVSVLGVDQIVPAHSGITPDSSVVLLVRPESVSVRKLPGEGLEVVGRTGRILSSVFYGAWIEYDVETEAGNMTAMVYDPLPGDIMPAGTFVSVAFEAERSWLLPAEVSH